MEDKDGFGFNKNSKLHELFKLLQRAMEEQNNESEEDIIDSYFKQFNDNVNHTFFNYSELDQMEPDKIERFKEGNLTYEVKYWYLPEGGHYKSVEITGDGSTKDLDKHINNIMDLNPGANNLSVDVDAQPKKQTLEELLKEAVEKEEFMLAAKIRDEINSKQTMEGKIAEINIALAQGDIDKSQRLLNELREIKK